MSLRWLLRKLLGPWGVVAGVRCRILAPCALAEDFESVSRSAQYRALLGLTRRGFRDAWVIAQLRRLLYSEYPVIRSFATERILTSPEALVGTQDVLLQLMTEELRGTQPFPAVTTALAKAARKHAAATPRMVPPILNLLRSTHSPDPVAARSMRTAVTNALEWAQTLPHYLAENAREELPPLLATVAAPEALRPGDEHWYGKVIVPFAVLLIRTLVADPGSREWLNTQRDELALLIFQHAPHPRMKMLGRVLSELTPPAGSTPSSS